MTVTCIELQWLLTSNKYCKRIDIFQMWKLYAYTSIFILLGIYLCSNLLGLNLFLGIVLYSLFLLQINIWQW